LFQFSDYPIEKAVVFISACNPIDLARIMILLHLDVSAMMGYTGAVFKDYFGSSSGIVIVMLILALWVSLPYTISLSKFMKKDL
jgi:Cu-processing system permease protein